MVPALSLIAIGRRENRTGDRATIETELLFKIRTSWASWLSWSRSAVRVATLGAIAFGLAACSRSPEQTASTEGGPVYATAAGTDQRSVIRFAVNPGESPAQLYRSYQPLMDYLNEQIPGSHFVPEASRDFTEFERKIQDRSPEFLLPNPWQSLQAMKQGYSVIATAGTSEDFRGLIIVRRDGPIRAARDLQGKAVAYPSPTALAGCIMPQWFLHTQGLDVVHAVENLYVGSHESAIMNVYLGQTAAGGTWPKAWRAFVKEHPQEAKELEVRWETPTLINNSVMARADVPTALRDKVCRLLIDLDRTPAGRALLEGMEAARFLSAADSDYQPVRTFVERFEKEVRPVRQK